MKIRYIRDWANGNSNGTNSNWKEIEAFDINGNNIALNKNVTSPFGNENINRVTDGDKNQVSGNDFVISQQLNREDVYVQVDLGDIYEIKEIKIYRFFPSENSTTQYNATKTQVSIDGETWITVFDSVVDGKYYETVNGKSIKLEISDVLEQDAGLKDVIDEFEKISNINLSTVNVVTASSLPSVVKEGQVVIITSIQSKNIILDYQEPSNFENGDIFIKYFNENKNKFKTKGNVNINLDIFGAKQFNDGILQKVESYIGINGQWVGMNDLVIFENGDKTSITGGYDTNLSVMGTITINNNYIKFDITGNESYDNATCRTNNKIDVTNFNKLYIEFDMTGINGSTQFIASLYNSSTSYTHTQTTNNYIAELDISNVNGLYNLNLALRRGFTGTSVVSAKVYKIWLE